MKAYVFPGQGAQFIGMGKELYDNSSVAKELFEQANEELGFRITDIMFFGEDDELKQTKVTQPAIFLHSVILAKSLGDKFQPEMVAGHSLGEFSALVANNCLDFIDALKLVHSRAIAMQKACDAAPSTMAAILGLEDEVVETICSETDGIVVAANYNCPGQLVISGEIESIHNACNALTQAGARRALVLPVGGAFHSPLMLPAKKVLEEYIQKIQFKKPSCPIYQNSVGKGVSSVEEIKKNLVNQLISPVLWTQSINRMIDDGITNFVEVGPGKVLQGLIKKINPDVNLEV